MNKDRVKRGSGRQKAVQLLLLILSTFLLFQVAFFAGTHPSLFIAKLFQLAADFIHTSVRNTVLRDFLIHGVITGTGGLFVYIPNIVSLFLLSHLLKTSGVHEKAGMFIEPVLKKAGLNRNSVIPFTFGFGCTVNALHSAESINSERIRMRTMLVSPFMSCGSKFGVYMILIAAVFQPELRGIILTTLYISGIIVALITSLVIKKLFIKDIYEENDQQINNITPDKHEYKTDIKIPDIRLSLNNTLRDTWLFIRTAGTVIIAASIIIWALSYFPGVSHSEYTEIERKAENQGIKIPPRRTLSLYRSYLSKAGKAISPIFSPLGFDWKTSVAVIAGFTGRGAIVSTLNLFYGIQGGPEQGFKLEGIIRENNLLSPLSALSLMFFVLISGGCLAAIAMFFNYTGSVKMTAVFVLYPVVLAWIISFAVYQTGRLIN